LRHLTGLNSKCSTGPDNIPNILLKKMAHCLAQPLALLFTYFYSFGILPAVWKLAIVIPIFKKGSKSDPGNYRPISLTSVCSKVYETILKQQLFAHLRRNFFFDNAQHGFLPGSSTTTNLIESLDILSKGFRDKVTNCAIHFDFCQGFRFCLAP